MNNKHLILPILLALAAGGCSRPKVAVYDAPKDAAPVMTASAGPSSPDGESSEGGRELSLAWKVPAGWSQQGASDMRVATLIPPASKGKAELSIVQLGGDAGGDLANVNRWRGQLGLEPVASLAGQADTVGTPAGKTLVVELKGGAGQAMLAAILKDNESCWFFKLAGPSAVVAALKPEFRTFLRSLRHGGA